MFWRSRCFGSLRLRRTAGLMRKYLQGDNWLGVGVLTASDW